jgi:hypothetical protein
MAICRHLSGRRRSQRSPSIRGYLHCRRLPGFYAHLSTFIGVAAILFSASMILLTGRYSPFWLWMQGIMLGFAINTMIGTWKPSEFRWASVSVIAGVDRCHVRPGI